MEDLDERYYSGYWGEDEYFFIIKKNGEERRRIGLWEGYIWDMMRKVEPKEFGWEGLANFYNVLSLDCKDEKTAWHADDPDLIYEQLASITPDMVEFPDTMEVVAYLMEVFKEAIDNNEDIYIFEK